MEVPEKITQNLKFQEFYDQFYLLKSEQTISPLQKLKYKNTFTKISKHLLPEAPAYMLLHTKYLLVLIFERKPDFLFRG